MANSVGLSPAIKDANFTIANARSQMGTRLENSRKLVQASEHFESNQDLFNKNRDGIAELVKKTAALSAAIKTVSNAGHTVGNCTIAAPGKVYGTRPIEKPLADVNGEIQSNLENDVVQTALRTLGIVETSKTSFFAISERPSSSSLVKGGIAAIALAGAGAALVYRDEIPGLYYNGIEAVKGYSLPQVPSMDEVKALFSNIGGKVSDAGYQAGTAIQDVVSSYPIPVGVGAAIAAVGTSFLIYKAVQGKKSGEQSEQV